MKVLPRNSDSRFLVTADCDSPKLRPCPKHTRVAPITAQLITAQFKSGSLMQIEEERDPDGIESRMEKATTLMRAELPNGTGGKAR
jgi:hypothetical protein